MAHLSPPFPCNRCLNHDQYWNEKYAKSSAHEHQPMTNIIPPPAPKDGPLTKPTYDRSNQNNISLKSNSFNEKKCPVYVHHFNKIPSKSSNNYIENNWRSGSEIHQNLYKHECSDCYDTKIHSLKKQFDSLSLQSKKPQTNSPYKIPKAYKCPTHDHCNHLTTAVPYAKSSLNAKINKLALFQPEDKAAIVKLEESYWSEWRPNKNPATKVCYPKMKGLYTEKEKIKVHCHQNTNKNGRKERGDSNNAIIPPEKDETSDNDLICAESSEQKNTQQEKEDKVEIYDNEEAKNLEKMLTGPSYVPADDSDAECSVSGLKHTDSFILIAKNQSQEKPHYQQPKCIKLFKKADYTTSTSINYIKGGIRGGSYPLKSCLKKQNTQKSYHLGRPGSSLKTTTTRRPGKANRFTK